MSEKFYDAHTIFLRFDIPDKTDKHVISQITEEKIREHILNAISVYEKANPDAQKVGRSMHINIPRAKYKNIAYVHLESKEVYFLIVGKNADGTDRLKYEAFEETNCPEFPNSKKKLYFTYLPPLIDISSIEFSCGTVGVSAKRASVGNISQNRMSNILKFSECPAWLSHERIQEYFKRFVPNKNDKYPIINSNSESMVFITFDPSTRDAQFSLLMTMDSSITQKDPFSTFVLSKDLSLEHSYKTARDIASALTMGEALQKKEFNAPIRPSISLRNSHKALV